MINVLHLFILVLVSLVPPRASAREYEEWFVPFVSFRYATFHSFHKPSSSYDGVRGGRGSTNHTTALIPTTHIPPYPDDITYNLLYIRFYF